ncbi:MAG: GDP-mannose 4,6 dehydratase [Verrucomicrobiota bacterium]
MPILHHGTTQKIHHFKLKPFENAAGSQSWRLTITNVVGTLRLLDFCRRMIFPTFVFASSFSVYGPVSLLPFAEDGPTAP